MAKRRGTVVVFPITVQDPACLDDLGDVLLDAVDDLTWDFAGGSDLEWVS